MPDDNLKALKQGMIDGANMLVRTGAISMSHHGNFSARIPGTEHVIITASASFDSLGLDNFAVVDLDGKLVDGSMNATNSEIIHMHMVIYRHKPDIGSVVHTHSPYATAFAVASRALECTYEAMVRSGMTDAVPVAHYGPRGSEIAVANIAACMPTATRAVLLENHGVLAFGATPTDAARANLVIEESAQIALWAEGLGGAKAIPLEMRKATIERAAAFAQAGTQQA